MTYGTLKLVEDFSSLVAALAMSILLLYYSRNSTWREPKWIKVSWVVFAVFSVAALVFLVLSKFKG